MLNHKCVQRCYDWNVSYTVCDERLYSIIINNCKALKEQFTQKWGSKPELNTKDDILNTVVNPQPFTCIIVVYFFVLGMSMVTGFQHSLK